MYYGRADGYTTATAATSPATSGGRATGQGAGGRGFADEGAGDSPAEWGMAIHSDSAGRPDTFTRTLPGGRQVLTHVFWAPHIRPQDIR